MALREHLDRLLVQAETALSLEPAGAPDELIGLLDVYLQDFDAFQGEIEVGGSPGSRGWSGEEKSTFRAKLERLNLLHDQIIAIATAERDAVGKSLGELQNRNRALKKYVDQYPERISLTGKRKG